MADAKRAEDVEGEDRRTHGYIQERDVDRNARSDTEDEEKEKAAAEQVRKSKDLNNNGIPDHLESNPANDDHTPFDSKVHRNSTLDRETRHTAGIVAATQTTDEPSPDLKDRVRAANAKTSKIIQEDESNPKKGDFGRDALAKRMKKLRSKTAQNGTSLTDLSRLTAGKSDPDNGFEVMKASWRGMLTAMIAMRSKANAIKNAERNREIEDLRLTDKALKEAEANGQAAAQKGKEAARENGKDEPEKETPKEEASKEEASKESSTKDDQNKPSGPEGQNKSEDGPGEKPGSPGGMPGPDGAAAQPDDAKPANKKAAEAAPASQLTAETNGGAAIGDASVGMALASVNPAAGVGLAAAQANEAQKAAGRSFDTTKTAARKPEYDANKSGVALPGSAVTALDTATLSAQRLRGLALAPSANDAAKPRTIIQVSAEKRTGPLFDQARKLPRPEKPVHAAGPTNPAPRNRAMGLGSGISMFTKAVRAIASKEEQPNLAQLAQKQRDSDGRGR